MSEQTERFSKGKLLVSLFILAILFLQTFASFGLVAKFFYMDRAWPFLDYPMYSQSKNVGDKIDDFTLLGITADSSLLEIRPEDLNLSYWKYLEGPVAAVLYRSNNALLPYAHLYVALTGRRIIGFALRNAPYVMEQGGFVKGPAEIVKMVYFDVE